MYKILYKQKDSAQTKMSLKVDFDSPCIVYIQSTYWEPKRSISIVH